MGLEEVCRHVFRGLASNKMTGRLGLSRCTMLAMVLLLISIQMCSCFVLKDKPEYKVKPHHKKHMKHGFDSEPLDVVDMKPVSIDQFESELNKARDYRDVLRIFYGKHLSDNVMDEILAAESPYDKHASKHREHGFSSDRSYDRRRDGDAAVKHMNEMRYNELTECKPRPKVIHMQDNLSMGTKILFWPKCTVVYRCQQDSGCCGHDTNRVCLPKSVERVAKSFLVTERIMGSYVQPRYESFTDTIIFENHTECECQYKATHNKNKCSDCPFPYTLTKGAPDCICDCDPGSIVCMEIKVGNRSFDEKPLQCIKEERCQTPVCAHGNFDLRSVQTGYCPGKKKVKPNPGFHPRPQGAVWDKNHDLAYIDIGEDSSGFGDDMEDDDYEEESSNFIDYEP